METMTTFPQREAPVKLCEYLLVFSPMGDVYDTVAHQKKYFTSAYQNTAAVYGKPHITLANFVLSGGDETLILQRLRTIAENSNRIRVVLKDYKWFRTHTMYLDVLYKADIRQLVRKISSGLKWIIKRNTAFVPHFISVPHLTICKDLTTDQYERSRVEYEDKTFSGEFTADAMILLKRAIGGPKYHELARFEFGGPENLNFFSQGDLFQ